MKQKFVFATIALVLFGLTALVGNVSAQECTTQYGGTVDCPPTDLVINKQVSQPVTNTKGGVTASATFVENLGTATPYAAGSEVVYRLIVTNNSGQTFNPVTVKDVLPTYLTFVSGPGTYDAPTRTLTIQLENLIAGETRTIDFVAQVVSANQFPVNQNVFCVTNYAEARALNRFDSDTAQLCLAAAASLPVAGYDDMLLLLPFAGVGLSGLVLIKKKN